MLTERLVDEWTCLHFTWDPLHSSLPGTHTNPKESYTLQDQQPEGLDDTVTLQVKAAVDGLSGVDNTAQKSPSDRKTLGDSRVLRVPSSGSGAAGKPPRWGRT